MSATPHLRLDAQERCNRLCTRWARVIDREPSGMKTRARLRAAVAETRRRLKEYRRALAQEHAWSLSRRKLRRMLRDALTACIRIGRVIRHEKGDTLLLLDLPRKSDTEVIADARTIFDVVEAHGSIFEDYGLPRRVLARIPRLISALEDARTSQSQARGEHHVMRKEILRSLGTGDHAAIAMGVILADLADSHPEFIVKFRAARRVGRARAVPRRTARRAARVIR